MDPNPNIQKIQGATQKSIKKSFFKTILPTFLTDTIEQVGTILPNSIKKKIKETRKKDQTLENEKITRIHFEHLPIPDLKKRKLFLIICYVNGFQIWDVDNPEIEHKEVVSVRLNFEVRTVKFLLQKPEKMKFEDIQLIVIPLKNQDKFLQSHLLIYSIKESQILTKYKFEENINGVLTTPGHVIIGTKLRVFVLDAENLQIKYKYDTYPCSNFETIFDVGSRFLVFPTKELPPFHSQNITKNNQREGDESPKLTDSIKKSTKNVVSKVSDSLTDSISEKNAGVVMIKDLKNNKTISHFRAHKHAISSLFFNDSGSLLFTSSMIGTHFRIFRINPTQDETKPTIELLYTLIRGMTSAIIQNVSFSQGSKWVVVSTNHGTSHIFAINATGEPVSISTHLPEYISQVETINEKTTKTTYKALYKIKQNTFEWTNEDYKKDYEKDLTIDENENENKEIQPLLLSSVFNKKSTFYIATKDGILSEYSLSPKPLKVKKALDLLSNSNEENQKKPKFEFKTFVISPKNLKSWYVCRKNYWKEIQGSIKEIVKITKLEHSESEAELSLIFNSQQNNPKITTKFHNYFTQKQNQQTEPQNMEEITEKLIFVNIETATHESAYRDPLWKDPQFDFCKYIVDKKIQAEKEDEEIDKLEDEHIDLNPNQELKDNESVEENGYFIQIEEKDEQKTQDMKKIYHELNIAMMTNLNLFQNSTSTDIHEQILTSDIIDNPSDNEDFIDDIEKSPQKHQNIKIEEKVIENLKKN
ncbi:breast carcinoma-amplified sequence 3 [Anaeramoeba ignava]|uniref:Breast carcinoma-amplified sequence 3 n=1 Tax=Anaeramoeba ignava TaxID=1746090 RepID=A0A9Q0RGL9_ANAIG|nr:breast carcinoma-amplified sequence 3 [Anaeramoeba ignava]|eukprot:Anaeramoba_ignava/a611138_36.p1 GENE.a611138_36~~a611138_36.p1  ORF type:complete len:758 (-),score=267.87 a611138_36:14-2287(-)